MAEELVKTCENCEYEHEDMEGTHCRHCIHNAEEHFAPKINHEKEIRNKAIDEFAEALKKEISFKYSSGQINHAYRAKEKTIKIINQIAEQMKGAQK